MKIQFVPHRKQITSPLQRSAGLCCIRKQSLFIVEISTKHINTLCAQNADFSVLKQVVHRVTIGF
jgi:hypothetical protein